ncbi:cysteine-rich receptor-like protein kinase 2 [Tanacetum coccineum]
MCRLIKMKVSISLIVILISVDRLQGDPRSQVIRLTCDLQPKNNVSTTILNFVQSMETISTQIRTSNSGTAVTGIGPDRTYVLAECYGDLSTDDCHVCSTEARGNLATCLSFNGGRVFLDGCFLRTQNYNFYQEYKGSNDTVICGNTSMGHVFRDSVRRAISDVVRIAPRNKRFFARGMMLSDIANESVYVLADCWNTLNESSCAECLNSAFESMVKCFPWSEGRALHTGCIIRYSNTNFLNPEPKKGNKGGKRTVIAVAVSFFLAFFIVSFITFYAWKRRSNSRRKRGSDDTKLLKILKSSSLNFKYSTIEKATRYFDESNKLGEGGFGTVYKGVLPCGKEIAVKRLFFNHRHRAGDFYNEVNIISSVDHKNLVKLVGFSCLGPENAVRGKELNWAKRYDIILGIAEGLAYLHENTKTRIIHRDIKAANILLDSRFRAKIADFGLARSYQQDKNHISTGIAGTLGYMAPEYITHGKLTEKVDVFSFGVLLLEVVTGMPNRGKETSEDGYGLVSIVWKHFQKGLVAQIYDPNLMLHTHTDDNVKKEIQSVVHIGLLCTQEVASLRPTMSMALQMLSKNIEPLPSPATPPYVIETNDPNLFSLKINHGGGFSCVYGPKRTRAPRRVYKGGNADWFDDVDADGFSVIEVSGKGLEPLSKDIDVLDLLSYVHKFKLMELFIEHHVDTSVLDTSDIDLYHKDDFDEGLESGNDGLGTHESEGLGTHESDGLERGNDGLGTYESVGLGTHDTKGLENDNSSDPRTSPHIKTGDVGVDIQGSDNNEESNDSEDSEFECDIEDRIDDVDVDMEMFRKNTDASVEWDFDSDIDSNDDEAERKKAMRKLDMVTRISVEKRRELYLNKNDNKRVKAECRVRVPVFSNVGPSGDSGSNVDRLADDLSRSQSKSSRLEKTKRVNIFVGIGMCLRNWNVKELKC